MARIKIDYGIDLGTTNSSIARMENGRVVVKKTKNLMETMPSCVYFSQNKKGEKAIRVGLRAKDSRYSDAITALNSNTDIEEFGYIEFKREMGTGKIYSNSNMSKDFYTPEELSAEVLKELKSLITDESFDSVVITVPAMFTAIQKDATMKAAKLAGFKHCALLQEPIAACMAYGLNSNQSDAKWLVFDFGGGTFDAALVKVEDRILTVFDTEGDNYLGGKNLDQEVVSKILLPHLMEEYSLDFLSDKVKEKNFIETLKGIAEELRVSLSFQDVVDYSTYDRNISLGTDDCDEEIDLEITLTKEQLEEVLKPQYQKAIDICKNLLQRQNIRGNQLNSLILVGGPTLSPIVRDMLKEQITENVDTSIDPMIAVATGASLYASTLDREINEEDILDIQSKEKTVFLDLSYQSTTVENEEWVAVSINVEKSDWNKEDSLVVYFERDDGQWVSDKTTVSSDGNIISTFLVNGISNKFNIKAIDSLGNFVKIFPSEFNIIQGIKIGAAPLPYNIGISVFDDTKNRGVFKHAIGLEKNKPLPAVGTLNGRRTTQDLRPGNKDDKLSVLIYQAPLNAEGKSTDYYTKIGSILITGDEVPVPVHTDSVVDITLKVDQSEMMRLEVYFPEQDFTIEKELLLDARISEQEACQEIEKLLQEAENKIEFLDDNNIDTSSFSEEYESVNSLYQETANSDYMRVLSNVKELLIKLEELSDNSEWYIIEKQLDSLMGELEKIDLDQNPELSEKYDQIVESYNDVKQTHNCSLGRNLCEEMETFALLENKEETFKAIAWYLASNFDSFEWNDELKAKALLGKLLDIIEKEPYNEQKWGVYLAQIFDLNMSKDKGRIFNSMGLLR